MELTVLALREHHQYPRIYTKVNTMVNHPLLRQKCTVWLDFHTVVTLILLWRRYGFRPSFNILYTA